jgi:hypothetical protein
MGEFSTILAQNLIEEAKKHGPTIEENSEHIRRKSPISADFLHENYPEIFRQFRNATFR